MQTTRAQQNIAQAEKLLASAQHKATIDGDLKGAIDELQEGRRRRRRAIAHWRRRRSCAWRNAIRSLATRRRRPSTNSLLRDYADQKDVAVVARSRLSSTTVRWRTSRAIGRSGRAEDADGFGTISPDGRYLTYTDWHNAGNLAIARPDDWHESPPDHRWVHTVLGDLQGWQAGRLPMVGGKSQSERGTP